MTEQQDALKRLYLHDLSEAEARRDEWREKAHVIQGERDFFRRRVEAAGEVVTKMEAQRDAAQAEIAAALRVLDPMGRQPDLLAAARNRAQEWLAAQAELGRAREALKRVLERRSIDCGEHGECCQCKTWPHEKWCASRLAWEAGVAALAPAASPAPEEEWIKAQIAGPDGPADVVGEVEDMPAPEQPEERKAD